MNKKIGFLKLIIPVFMGLGMLLTSCLKEHDYYSIGDFYVTFGTIEMKSAAPNDYIIHLDHGDNVVPVATSVPSFVIKNNQRVLVNFNPLSDEKLTDSTVTYLAKITGLREILFKDIKKYTDVADDSMGHDSIIVREAWISKTGGILNIDMKYYTHGSVHYINLIDNGQANGIDNPFILELRHNARGDRKDYPVTGYVSFRLDYLKLPGKHQTKFFIRYTDYNGRRIDLPETYNY
ncbi:MAG TPA: NigD-like C-terminal domain-containing protein [Prolixibacteraceae bacterium]|jgi:hypothetical protein